MHLIKRSHRLEEVTFLSADCADNRTGISSYTSGPRQTYSTEVICSSFDQDSDPVAYETALRVTPITC